MADKKGTKPGSKGKAKGADAQTRIKRYTFIHKYSVGVSILTFFLIIIQGLRAEVSVITITYRTVAVCLAIYVLTRIIVKAIASFEEINNGES